VTRETISVLISGPGKTVALVQQKVRAPFAGTLRDLTLADGDAVHQGQTVAAVVSRDSEAALIGAQEMLRQAVGPKDREDAERALALARQNLVQVPLRASASGVVISHAASSGDRVAEDQEILTVAVAGSTVFQADISQTDLARIRRGQKASVQMAGREKACSGVVRAILGTANAADLTAPVRIDLDPLPEGLTVGLFGTARITVEERRDSQVVPDAAILRDDLTGSTRIVTVGNDGRAHWLAVTTGVRSQGWTEILSPELALSTPVIVSGQVGLPDGSPVVQEP
jgi:HlyD family secretion protein